MTLLPFALPFECGLLKQKLRSFDSKKRPRILITGMGQEAFWRVSEAFLKEHRVKRIIHAGFCVGLHEEMSTGDWIKGNWTAREGNGPQNPPEASSNSSLVPQLAIERITTARPPKIPFPKHPKLLCVRNPMETQVKKYSCAAKCPQAVAADMESFAGYQLAKKYRLDITWIRVVSDTLREDFPVPTETLLPRGGQGPSLLGIAQFLTAHPGKILPFWSFVKNSFLARKVLTGVVMDELMSASARDFAESGSLCGLDTR